MEKHIEIYITEIEKNYLYKKIEENKILNNYKFLIENQEIYEKILNEIKTSKLIYYKKFNDILEFDDILKKKFKNDEIFFIYLSIFITESFNDGIIENNIINKKKKDIHDSINRIHRNISNLNIYIRKEEKLIEKDIDLLYEFILKIIKLLENKGIITKITIKQNAKLSYSMLELKNYKK
jgi:hypothetical protein